MTDLREVVAAAAAEAAFAGVVRVDRDGRTDYAEAFGFLDRAHGVPMTLDTQLATASVTKTFTAVAVLSLVADDTVALDTPARLLLGDDLPEVDERVTVEHLLAHRSGIGDYVDEDVVHEVSDYVLELPVNWFLTTEDFLPAHGRPAAGLGARRDVRLQQQRTGDGGAYATVDDLHAFWAALLAGRLLPAALVTEMFRARSRRPEESRQYGLGCWRYDTGDAVFLEGYDAGVSARSLHDPSRDLTWTVLSSWSDGAWPVVRAVARALA